MLIFADLGYAYQLVEQAEHYHISSQYTDQPFKGSTSMKIEDYVQLGEERKAAMVSNLLVVLCGDRQTQPVINTGTIYQ